MIFRVKYWDKVKLEFNIEYVEINSITDLENLQNRYQLLENKTYGEDAWGISLIVDCKNNTIIIYNDYME